MAAAPARGASASRASMPSARRWGFWWASISPTVFRPSAKSWAITAVPTTRPTQGETWKPRPMPIPSTKMWPTRAMAQSRPTSGWWWSA
ncbi:MAG: hypothetical protein DMF81_25130 [Acidobacteria bacterium]|nr:MAG: hypothetical protein DMF81_25130 [Acidobacteriota bacterium]